MVAGAEATMVNLTLSEEETKLKGLVDTFVNEVKMLDSIVDCALWNDGNTCYTFSNAVSKVEDQLSERLSELDKAYNGIVSRAGSEFEKLKELGLFETFNEYDSERQWLVTIHLTKDGHFALKEQEPEPLVAEDTTPVERVAEDTTPVERVAEHTTPVEIVAEDTTPVEIVAEDTTPVEIVAEDTTTVEIVADDRTPVEMVATKALDNIVNAAEDQTKLQGLIKTFRARVADLDFQLHFSELMVEAIESAKRDKYRTATSTSAESAKNILQTFVLQASNIADRKAAVVQAYDDVQAIDPTFSYNFEKLEERSAKILDDFEKYQEEDYQATVDRFEQLGKRYRQEFNDEDQKTEFQVKRWTANFQAWAHENCHNKLDCTVEKSQLNELIISARDDVVQAKADMIRLKMQRNGGELTDYKQIRARKLNKVINVAKKDITGNGVARNNLYKWSVECGLYETFKDEDLTAESGFEESNLAWYNRFAPKSKGLDADALCDRIQTAFDDIHSVL